MANERETAHAEAVSLSGFLLGGIYLDAHMLAIIKQRGVADTCADLNRSRQVAAVPAGHGCGRE